MDPNEGPESRKGGRAPGRRKPKREKDRKPRRAVFDGELEFSEGFDDVDFDDVALEEEAGPPMVIPPEVPPPPEDAGPVEREPEPSRSSPRTRREGPDVPESLHVGATALDEGEPAEVEAPSRPSQRRVRARPPRGKTGGGTRVPLFVPLIVAAGVVTLVISSIFTRFSVVDWGTFVFFLIIFIIAAHFEIKLKGGGTINLSLAPLLAALIALPVKMPAIGYAKITAAGSVEVIWLYLIGMIVVQLDMLLLFSGAESEHKREHYMGLILTYAGVGLAALVFFLVITILPKRPVLMGRYTPAVLVGVGLAACALYLVYLVRESYVLSRAAGSSMGVYLQSVLRKSWIPYAIIVFTGVAMGLVAVGIGIWSMIIFLLLLLIFMYAYGRVAATDEYLLETIRVLSVIPEETGLVPGGHAKRVAELASGVAREMSLAPEGALQVEFAAYLHDIGAITRQGEHRLEQRQLSEVEGVISGGVDIVGKVDYLEVASEILGGREGLRDRVTDVDKRRAVSLGAGILRAVDDFESLVQGSETREPLSENDALTEMNLERGVKYDSKVLRAIAKVVARIPRETASSAEGSSESSPFWGDQEG